MKTASSAPTPAAYLKSLPEERRADVTTLHRAIVKAAPTLKPFMLSGMIGYGKFHYRYATGREGDWAVVALANQKGHIGLYICAAEKDGGYLAEKNAARLGKVKVGRSCIRIKKLSDLNLPVALELVARAAQLLQKGGGSFVL